MVPNEMRNLGYEVSVISSRARNLGNEISVVPNKVRNLGNEVFAISERNLMKFSNFIFIIILLFGRNF
ncbi:MAG: hypothetical protein LBD03_08315 [Methanobrevibacter sp.]|nr:hypothetical protein [Candidatus Methanovirga procula]